MTTWNSGPYPPPDPNQGFYGGQPGYPPPPQQPYPGAGYPNPPPPAYPSGGPGIPYGQPGSGPYGAPPGGNPYGGGPYNQPDMYGASYSEDPEVKGFGFSDETIRRGFIRKVYSILMIQLTITTSIIALFSFNHGVREYAKYNPWLFILAIVVLFVSMIALACCGEVRRRAPLNFVLLGLFTVAESFMLGITSARYETEVVVMAVGITAVLCLGLTFFAFQTKWDFTICGGFLFICVLILFLFGFIISMLAMFHAVTNFRVLNLVYASIGAVLFSIYLIYDTQLMIGGKHKYSISPEEYIFAALNLYVDIINIFIYILTILGSSRD